MKKIYVIRHCEAEGQPPEAQLTEIGLKQAIDLTNFFSDIKVERIITCYPNDTTTCQSVKY